MVLVVIGVGLTLLSTGPVLAQDADPWYRAHSYEDFDEDGRIDAMTILAEYATNNDAIIVFDRNDNMQRNEEWFESVDFEEDLWLFDAASDGSIDLVIDFRKEGSGLTASLYDNLATSVSEFEAIYLDGGAEYLREKTPSVRVKTAEDWWIREGIVNYNVDIEVDGPISATTDPSILPHLEQDGLVNFQIQVRDENFDGIPDFEIRESFLPRSVNYNTARVWIAVAEKPGEVPNGHTLAWPYLSILPGSFVQVRDKLRPPIQVDWDLSRIIMVAEFVPSHAGDNVWYVQSFSSGIEEEKYPQAPFPAQTKEARKLDFENPFAYYDLAQDGDGVPELSIRQQIWLSDIWDEKRANNLAQTVRYSWDQNNDGGYDYALKLLGQHQVTSTVEVGDIQFHSIPYETFPQWVTERPWGATAFVAMEDRSFHSTEGIYEWDMVGPDWKSYAAGERYQAPFNESFPITSGMRGEYIVGTEVVPELYFSPVDHNLHLLQAASGVWNIDDKREVRYANLNGDAYLDQWTYLEDEAQQAQLHQSGDVLIYSGQGEVILKQAGVPAFMFRTSPPSDHREWVELKEKLESNALEFVPGDLRSMVDQFDGQTVRIEDAKIQDLRYADDGFHFILNLGPGAVVHSDDDAFLMNGTEEGSFLVSYDGNRYTVESSTPSLLQLEGLNVSFSGASPREREWTTIEAVLHNDGAEDAIDILLCAVLRGPEEQMETYIASPALLPGSGSESITWGWAPSAAGTWTVELLKDCFETDQGLVEGQFLGELDIEVAEGREVSPLWLMSLDSLVSEYTFLLLFAVVLLAGSAAFVWLREAGA